MRTTRILVPMLVGCAALLVSAGRGRAAEASEEEMGRVVKLPDTAADHLALAKSYDEKAKAQQKEADYHRDMAAAYKKAHPDLKGGVRDPWTVKMERHCTAIVKDAEKLAQDEKVMADFHRLRARELQGK